MSGRNPRVLFSQRFLDEATRALFAGNGVTLEEAPLKPGQADADLPTDDLVAMLDGVQGWIVGHVRIDRALLERIPSVKSVARRSSTASGWRYFPVSIAWRSHTRSA